MVSAAMATTLAALPATRGYNALKSILGELYGLAGVLIAMPLVAIGLYYRAGYFRQAIGSDGWQRESYPVSDPDGLPMKLLRAADGSPELV